MRAVGGRQWWSTGGVVAMLLASPCSNAQAKAAQAGAASEGFTLEQAIEAHATRSLRSDALTALPGGRHLAWIDDGRVRVASAPTFAARELALPASALPPVSLHPSTDGRSLIVACGGVLRAFAQYPAQDSRQWWLVDVEQGPARLLAQGADVPAGAPVFSPDGRSFAVADGAMLYRYALGDARLVAQPLLLQDPQHFPSVGVGQLAWSPDGTRLAFSSRRKAGQSYIGIVDVATRAYRYVDPGIFRDIAPAWSPDGQSLAFVRSTGNWTREYRFSPVRDASPWSLQQADAATGAVRTIWRAETGTGSVFKPYATGTWYDPTSDAQPQLLWTRDGQLLFPWEKSGWLRVYQVAVDDGQGGHGGKATALTPDGGEVTWPSLSADQRSLVYASNQGDLARMHLWRVARDGSAPQAITSGIGVQHSPRLLADGVIAYLGNDNGDVPNHRIVRHADGREQRLTPETAWLDAHRGVLAQFVAPKIVTLRASDGVASHHLVSTPRTPPPPGGYPVIVASKGGPVGRVSPGNGVSSALGQYAVSRGYVFVEINYRGGEGFGLDYRFPARRGATGSSELLDLEAVARYLQGRRDVDRRRVAIMGGSYGGHMVGLALTRLPQYFAAGAHLSGVGDWVVELKKDQADGWASAPPEFIRLSERSVIEDLAYDASSTSRIEAWRAPTLITMGESDTSGHMESIIDLGERLLAQGVHVEFQIAPEAGHTGERARPSDKVFEFFERVMPATAATR